MGWLGSAQATFDILIDFYLLGRQTFNKGNCEKISYDDNLNCLN